MAIKLTKQELDILLHRLEAADAVAEALSDDIEDDEERDGQAAKVSATVDALYVTIRETKSIPSVLNEIDKLVLRDAIDGSTYLAAACGNTSPQIEGRIYAAGCRLASKVSTAIGSDVRYPQW